DLLPLQQALVLFLKSAIYLINPDKAADPVNRRLGGPKRAARHIERRCGNIAQAGAQGLEHRLIGLASDEHRPGEQDQRRQRRALDAGTQLGREADHSAPPSSIRAGYASVFWSHGPPDRFPERALLRENQAL